jgi:hypothetical protein
LSHFTTIKTQFVDKAALLSALRDLGYIPEEGTVEIRGYQGIRTPVEIRVATDNPEYDIGFRQMSGKYEVVADWFGLRHIDQKQFIEQLAQRYAYHVTLTKLQEQGFTVSSEEKHADGRIHLVLRRMA